LAHWLPVLSSFKAVPGTPWPRPIVEALRIGPDHAVGTWPDEDSGGVPHKSFSCQEGPVQRPPFSKTAISKDSLEPSSLSSNIHSAGAESWEQMESEPGGLHRWAGLIGCTRRPDTRARQERWTVGLDRRVGEPSKRESLHRMEDGRQGFPSASSLPSRQCLNHWGEKNYS
jgi:hypothetical protein